MNKNKLRDILHTIDQMEGKTSVSLENMDGDISGLAEKLINEQTDAFRKSVSDTPVIQALSRLSKEIQNVKSNFDLTPLISSIKNIDTSFDSRIQEVETKITKEIARTSKGKTTSFDSSQLTESIATLKYELDTLKTQKIKEVEDVRKGLESILSRETADIRARLDRMDEEEANEPDLVSPLRNEINDLRTDVYSRITSIANTPRHGDHANRNIAVNSNTSVLSRYTDVNLKAGSNVTLTAVPNNTTKYTDITITASGSGGTPSIGGGIAGGNDGTVLFVHPASVIAQDTNFSYDTANNQLRVGLTGAPFDTDNRVRAEFVSNINDYGDVAAQNQSAGDSATTDFFTSADNDSSTLIGHYTDFGITGSGWNPVTAGNIKVISLNAAGTGYSINDDLFISGGGDGNGEVTVTSVDGSGHITGILLANNGTGYVTGNGYATTGGTGSGATINVLSIIDFTTWSANDGYIFNSGGNFNISTDTANKDVVVTVGGLGIANQVARFNAASVLVLGNTSSVGGQINLKGKTSGITNLQVPSVAGSYKFVLPPNAGSNGNILQTDGNGITSWGTAGGSGINRSTSIISVSSTLAAAASTDYVFFANVGIQITLPTAIGNSNRYTVKNISTGSILVNTTAGQTIDGSASALMPVANQSIDLISNASVWQVI